MTPALFKATLRAKPEHLPTMVLAIEHLPTPYTTFKEINRGPLSNHEMAQNGFPGSSEEKYQTAGRVTGYMREFRSPSRVNFESGTIFSVASVVHLFDTPGSVSNWLTGIFLKDFRDHIGKNVGHDQTLIDVDQLDTKAFFDQSLAIKAVHETATGLVSSTIIDFRIGRLLGVVFVGVEGNENKLVETIELGLVLEQNIVAAILGK